MKTVVYPEDSRENSETGSDARRQQQRRPAGWRWPQILGVSFCFVSFNPTWRFTFSYVPNIGVAYIVAYVTMGLLVGLPLLLVQLRLGGLRQTNIIGILSKRVPLMKGLGIAMLLKSAIQVVFMHVTLAHILFYMSKTLTTPYEWSNRPGASDPVSYYISYYLNMSTSILNVDSVIPLQVLPLLLAWIFTFLLVVGGPTIFGWLMTILGALTLVSVFTLFGYVFSRHDTQSESNAFFSDYFRPKWGPLVVPGITKQSGLQIWFGAAADVVFTLSCLTGVLPSVGKFCGRSKATLKVGWVPMWLVSMIIPMVIMCAFSTFVPRLLGSGFAFIQMPTSFSGTDFPPFPAFLFYAILYLTGASAMALILFTIVDTIFESVYYDPRGRAAGCYRAVISLIVCSVGFLLGILQTTPAGRVWYTVCNRSLEIFGFVFIILLAVLLIICYGRESSISLGERIGMALWYGLACIFIAVMSVIGTVSMMQGPMYAEHTIAGVIPMPDTSIYSSLPELPTGPSMQGPQSQSGGVQPISLPQQMQLPGNMTSAMEGHAKTVQILTWLIALGPLVLGLMSGLLHSVMDSFINDKTVFGKAQRCRVLCCGHLEGREPTMTINYPEFPESPMMGAKRKELDGKMDLFNGITLETPDGTIGRYQHQHPQGLAYCTKL